MTLAFVVAEIPAAAPSLSLLGAAPALSDVEIVSRQARLMGGLVGVHLQPETAAAAEVAASDAAALLGRIAAWATRLTRFSTESDLSILNADPRSVVPIRPTLAAVLDWGRAAEGATDGIVNIAMLDQRMAAEAVAPGPATPSGVRASAAWSLERGPRRTAVRRPPDVRFDLDGVGKGWLADRALARLGRHGTAVVDADGDIAIRLGPGYTWWIGVVDPDDPDHDVATLRLEGASPTRPTHFGVATSGRSIHRWARDGQVAHHLIDPRTARPATTDVIQATVIAGSARLAEVYAKAAVILGSVAGLAALDRPGVEGVLLLTERGEVLASPGILRYLS